MALGNLKLIMVLENIGNTEIADQDPQQEDLTPIDQTQAADQDTEIIKEPTLEMQKIEIQTQTQDHHQEDS